MLLNKARRHTRDSTASPIRLGLLLACLAAGGTLVSGRAGAVGEFDTHEDIGAPALAGTADYNGATQEYRLSAGGTNMWAERDEFQFAWRRMTGDFMIQARIDLLGEGVDPHRKAGLMVRATTDDDSPYADAMIHGDGLTSLQFRRTKGAITEQVEATAAQGSDVLRLERKGTTFIMSAARFGEPFTVVEATDLALGDEVLVGLALCSHNPAVVERAVFQDVRITRPAADNFRPYRDYIGSVLEILDVESGRREMIHRSTQPFEAPNWTADGNALIFNASGADPAWRGRLHRFDLLTRTSTVIDTGTNIRNNNDHVLSPDGTMLAISDQSLQGVGSTIFTVPVTGGTPKRITTEAPSYMHSWSPDAKWLIFTGGRNRGQGQNLDIYRIAADGSGTEERLTTEPGVDDGPEYTPDGKYIYFNSVRTGNMQIWRMAPDGSNPEQITHDDLNNWFPHISPDGRWISIISFPSTIDVSDHPYYKPVYLRLLPIEGGEPRVVAYVYGGQGTINVPSWSPDGTRLAFVSNTGEY